MSADVVWEDIPCPLCGKRDEQPVIELHSPILYRVVRCRRCRMCYSNPRPNAASIGQFYPEAYGCYQVPKPKIRWWAAARAKLHQLATRHRLGTPPALTGRWQKLLAALAAPWFAPPATSMTSLPYHGQGRLLDYGCGSGWYAHRMHELGWDVTAMDFSAHAAATVHRHFGLPTLVGALPHPDVRPGSFDVITMGAVLEHVHHPHRVIAAAAEALRPGGYLVVSVPNFASWGARRFREHWWCLGPPQHLLHFTPTTLQRLLADHRLEVRRVQVMVHAGWLRRTLSMARAGGDRSLLVKLCRSRLATSLLSRWVDWRGEGDCILMVAHRTAAGVARAA
jgi:2-polyprenyl-3-methyl-5-hydroxy-6-metoxy-1,4-benzoquinol methylase